MKFYSQFQRGLIILIGSLLMLPVASCKSGEEKASSAKENGVNPGGKMEWWREAKFGMFIHWGLYAVPANDYEWHMRYQKKSIAEYSQYAKQFNPTQFDADEWAKIANEAGMKYMVITTKHHDGFALFDSEASSYNMVDATPFKRDIVKELAEACPKNDVRFGTYYSLMTDWGHAGGAMGCDPWDPAQVGDLDTYFNTIAFPQVRELLTNYGPIAELWFDTDGPLKPTPAQTSRIDSLIRLQPNMIVNNRVVPGDFNNAERHVPAQAIFGDWEACDMIIDNSWGYREYGPENVKPLSELIHQLIDVVSKGGNLLLNVGPKADGTFPKESVERLMGMGKWLKINGEAIYGTGRSPFDYLPWGRCTRKGDRLYLHVTEWPQDGDIVVPMPNEVLSASLLADPSHNQLAYETSKGELRLQLPKDPPDSIATVIVLEVKDEVQPVHSLACNKPSFASLDESKSKFAVDSDPYTYWDVIDPKPAWLFVDLGEAATFNTVRIGLSTGKIHEFSVKCWKNGSWETVFSDSDLPRGEYVKTFPPVTSNKVWFDVTEFDSGKTCRINSFELFDAH